MGRAGLAGLSWPELNLIAGSGSSSRSELAPSRPELELEPRVQQVSVKDMDR